MIRKSIPNILTLSNLFSGIITCLLIVNELYFWAGIMIALAAVFDFFDGFAARLLKVSGDLGKQMDSLADMVSFGVVPGFAMFMMLKNSMLKYNFGSYQNLDLAVDIDFVTLYALPGFLISLFSALRLAKFNIDTRQSDSFIGVPTPAITLLIMSMLIISIDHDSEFYFILHNPYFLYGITFVASYSLVADLPLFALKFKDFSWGNNKIRYIFVLLSLIQLIILNIVAIPLIIIMYVIMSIVYGKVKS
jgi:CDP-diacylglycerol---serine O-phosphatidyltransferase